MKKNKKERSISGIISDIILEGEVRNGESYYEWLRDNSFAKDTIKNIIDGDIDTEISQYVTTSDRKEHMTRRLEERLKSAPKPKYKLRKLVTVISVASLLLLSMALYYSNRGSGDIEPNTLALTEKIVNIETQHIETDEPIIITSSGNKINLNNNGKTLLSENTTIECSSDEEINISTNNEVIEYQSLIIPSQKSYDLVLCDGTKIKLNANSKLTFPNKFIGEYREVTLEGEAYFDVAKSDIPFIVKVNDINIKVLGTVFNVNSYSKDTIETYLVEGSIAMMHNKSSVIVKPNQLVITDNNSGKIDLIDDRVSSKYIGWIDNNFIFKSESIYDIATQLSNWYDKKVIVVDSDSTLQITAQYSRDTPIEEIITSLELIIGNGTFKID